MVLVFVLEVVQDTVVVAALAPRVSGTHSVKTDTALSSDSSSFFVMMYTDTACIYHEGRTLRVDEVIVGSLRYTMVGCMFKKQNTSSSHMHPHSHSCMPFDISFLYAIPPSHSASLPPPSMTMSPQTSRVTVLSSSCKESHNDAMRCDVRVSYASL